MRRALPFIIVMIALAYPALAQDFSATVVFDEPSFSYADTSRADLLWQGLLPGEHFAGRDQLQDQLRNAATKLLILPYGSAFPEDSWSDILLDKKTKSIIAEYGF